LTKQLGNNVYKRYLKEWDPTTSRATQWKFHHPDEH